MSTKCYSTVLTESSTVCAHCEQLWATMDDNLVFTLADDMDDARRIYVKGERKALKNWKGMTQMEAFFSQEVQAVKDLLADSVFELEASWPHVFWHQAMKQVTNEAGVLFADAGRSRNPYQRTKQDQDAICDYVQIMLRLWL